MPSLNKVMIMGHLGADPDIRTMQSGAEVANLSIGVSEKWKDKQTGEYKESTEWVRGVVFVEHMVDYLKKYASKGDAIYLEGMMKTRSWEQNGEKKYTTEVVVRPFSGDVKILSRKDETNSTAYREDTGANTPVENLSSEPVDDLEDEIPF